MSGSMGGGFRIIRALALLSYIGRELRRQLSHRLVAVPRVGGTVIDEQTVDRMLGYQVLFIGTATLGFLGLALTGSDLVTAISGAVSVLATFGPALGELAPGTPLTEVTHWALLVLMVLMLAGRVELYPVLNAVVTVGSLPARAWNLIVGRYRHDRTRRVPMSPGESHRIIGEHRSTSAHMAAWRCSSPGQAWSSPRSSTS